MADVPAKAVASILRWSVHRLRPIGEHRWEATSWQLYNVLFCTFFEGWCVSQLADRMVILEQTLYQARSEGITAVSHILNK